VFRTGLFDYTLDRITQLGILRYELMYLPERESLEHIGGFINVYQHEPTDGWSGYRRILYTRLCVLSGDFVKESSTTNRRSERVAHITHLTDPTDDACFSSAGRVTCGEVFLMRIKKSDGEGIANGLVRFLSRGEFGQDF